MTLLELWEDDKRHHIHPFTNPVTLRGMNPDLVTHAEGIYLYTSDGRRIIDLGSGLSNVNIGYGNPRLCEAASRTMRQLSYYHTGGGRSNPWAASLSAKLSAITPEQFRYFAFGATGSDAVETAIKIALRYWRLQGMSDKRAVISRRGSYHGGRLFAASLSGKEIYETQFGLPIADIIYHVGPSSWYRASKGRSGAEVCRELTRCLEDQIRALGPENVAAFVAAPHQGSLNPPQRYWSEIRRICDRYEVLLIADEVITGFGKTGQLFGFETFGIEPDLFAMAKGLSSGYFPMSAVGIGERVEAVLQNTDEVFAHIFTNSGHPVGAAVAMENIAFIEEHSLVDRVREEIGPYFRRRLDELLEFPCIGEVQALGVLGRFEIDLSDRDRPASEAEDAALLERISDIAWRKGASTHRGDLCLPMIITPAQIDEGIAILKESIIEAMRSHA